VEKISNRVKGKLSALISFLGLLILVLFFQIVTTGNLLTANNLLLIVKQGYALLIASLAGVFVVATGNLDFSIGAVAGFSCVCATLTATNISPWLSVPAAVMVGLGIGLLNGFAQNVLRLPSFIACLCMMFILMAATQSLITGNSIMMPVAMMNWDNNTVKIIFGILYVTVMVVLFRYTRLGKQLKALGVSTEAARQSGVNVSGMMTFAYALTGAAAGIAGFFLMLRTGGAATTTGQTLTTDVIIAIVFGGMSIAGGATSKIGAAILGTLIVTVLNNGMVLAGYGGDAQQLVKGLLFLAIIAVSIKRDANTIIK
jgi:ribose transport system permease protein